MKVGYVGLGAMGGSLARWLIEDHDLRVYDLNQEAVARLVSAGAVAADSLEQLARESDVIFLCLPRSKNVEQALFSESGLIAGLSAGKIIVDQTSGVGAETLSMAQRLNEIGVGLVDAPVAGGVGAAQNGTITIMLSGPEAALERAMPAFRSMTAKIYTASHRAGDAQSVKTLNNQMNMVFRSATLELSALAIRFGASLAELTALLQQGVAGNFTCRTVLPAIMEKRTTGDFSLLLMLKDCNQALELGMSVDAPMSLSALARGILQQNINIIGEHSKLDDIISYMAQACGVDFNAVSDREPPEGLNDLIVVALAAINRAVVYEIFTVAAKMGMSLSAFGNILNNGSAWSRQCEMVLAELANGATEAEQSLGDTVAALRALEQLNLYEGVATLMLGEVRAIYETAQRELSAEASITQLASFYERNADVKFSY